MAVYNAERNRGLAVLVRSYKKEVSSDNPALSD